MPRISDFQLVDLPEQPILRRVKTVGYDALPQTIGEGFAVIGASLRAAGGEPSDVPFVSFEEAEPGTLQVGVCFPLPEKLAGEGDIESVTLPAGKMVFCMYLGPYEGTHAVHEEMFAWIAKNGYHRPAVGYESYYNGQEVAPEHYLTKIAMPLRPFRP